MENAVSVQTLEFLYSALLGVFLGLVFDGFRVARFFVGRKKAVHALLDVLFWVFATLSLMWFVLTYSEGRMRWYVLFGVFSGAFVYLSALGEIVYKVLLTLVKGSRRVLWYMTYPVKLLLARCLVLIKKIQQSAEKCVRKKIRERRLKKRRAGEDGKEKKKRKQRHFS